MRLLLRCVPAGLALAALALLPAGPGAAGEGKGKVWEPVIPEDAYQELVQRAARTIQDEIDAQGKKAKARAQATAVRAAAYSLSAKGDKGNLIAVRENALRVARMIRDSKDLGEAKRLAKALPQAKAAGPGLVPDFPKSLDLADLMHLYRQKQKGGEGIAEALQSTRPLKNTNGVEDKVTYLAKKALKPAVLGKESKELALLSYQLAADGSLTAAFAKEEGKERAAEWQKYALAQRDAGVRLAEAATKKDAAAVHQAATALESACTQCHDKFRK
jgi:hypothetical protein